MQFTTNPHPSTQTWSPPRRPYLNAIVFEVQEQTATTHPIDAKQSLLTCKHRTLQNRHTHTAELKVTVVQGSSYCERRQTYLVHRMHFSGPLNPKPQRSS